MKDTAFLVAPEKLDRFAANYQRGADKTLKLIDDPATSDFTQASPASSPAAAG